jgi:hypothetical protein
MIRVVLKVFLMCITLIILGVFLLALVQMTKTLGQTAIPGIQAGATYGFILALLMPCLGYVLFNLKTLKIFSKIYNNENRDLSDRRPVDKNISTKIPKLYWISGIVWSTFLLLIALIYLYLYSSYNGMQDNNQLSQISTLLNTVTSITTTLAVWVVVDLLSTRSYLRKYTVSAGDEVDTIGSGS